MGSADIPTSIVAEFGGGIRKAAVLPFDLVYEYDEDVDVVVVDALIHGRAAW